MENEFRVVDIDSKLDITRHFSQTPRCNVQLNREVINKIGFVDGDLIEIKGKSSVETIILNKKHKNSNELKVDGVFVAIGHMALSELASLLGVELNKAREIKINHLNSETNVPGIYAAGDVTDKPFKQLITGVADACTAAYNAYEYIKKNPIFTY